MVSNTKEYGITLAEVLNAIKKRYADNPSMKPKARKTNFNKYKNFIEKELIPMSNAFGINITMKTDIAVLDDIEFLKSMIDPLKEKYKKRKNPEAARGTFGSRLKTVIGSGRTERNLPPDGNAVSLFEQAHSGNRTQAFNIAATRGKTPLLFPDSWDFHKAINNGFLAMDNADPVAKQAKVFGMLKLFTGIRNPDLLRLELVPEDFSERVAGVNYYDPKSETVWVYNKGKFQRQSIGKVGGALLSELTDDITEYIDEDGVKHRLLFDISDDLPAATGKNYWDIGDVGKTEEKFRNLVNTNIRESMAKMGLTITDSMTGEIKEFSISNFRANIFDILEEEFGEAEANKILGHSGGDASKILVYYTINLNVYEQEKLYKK